jgi:diguanylate cyclase (GGDEF)-like protein/PAS domain S-box-containing protein
MTALQKIKALLAVVIALFVTAAIYISTLVVERQDALKQVSRYNVAWLVSQATTEYARLEQRISAYAIPGSGVTEDEVQLRLDIVANRTRLLENGEVEDLISQDDEYRATVEGLRRAVAEAQPLVDKIAEPGNVAALLNLLQPLDARLARLAAAANRTGGDRVADDQRQLMMLHWLFSALAVGLIVCGVALIVLLIWHNRLLQHAHVDLNRAKLDLEAANRAVNDANAELQQQNRSLRERDVALRTQNERFDAALNNMSQGLCMVDPSQRLIVCNSRFQRLFGLAAAVVQPGTSIRDLFESTTSDSDFALGMVSAEQQALIREQRAGTYFRGLPDGRTFAVSHQPMADGGWVATYEDISERRRAETRIAHMAHHDALTDLPNRVLFRERMESAFTRLARHQEPVTVHCIDLDRFKDVNDTLGHPIGDALLKTVAERLLSCVRATDLVARLGGDEFGILQLASEEALDPAVLARRVLDVLSAPYELDGQQVVIGASIGVAIAPQDGDTPDQLLKNADLALYRAKADGRGTHRFFEAAMDAELQARRTVELDLRKALAAGEFEPYYQPLVSLETGEVTGCEALLRWHHPERGLVPPSEFIPIAEEIGLIGVIGDWVLRQACNEAASWPKPIKVAVNLSAAQLKNRQLAQAVILALASSGLPANRLELEITESVFLQDNDTTLAILHEIRNLGVRIAMDDFGTGYSSLSYLRSFPFDKIKIDRSFVRDLSTRVDCKAIVHSVATLGQRLGMVTTAEGIETAEQLDQLRLTGCTEGQGYYFGRPMPARDFVKGLQKIWSFAKAA